MSPWNSLSFVGLWINSSFHDKISFTEYKGLGYSLCSPLDRCFLSQRYLCAWEPFPGLGSSREGDPRQGCQGIESHMHLPLPRATARGELTNKITVSGGFPCQCILLLLGLEILPYKETGLQRARDLGTPEPNSYSGFKQYDLEKKSNKKPKKT